MSTPYQEVTQVIAVNGDQIAVAAAVTPGDTKSSNLVQYLALPHIRYGWWIIVDDDIYDVTKFRHEHPGGHKVMAGVAGKDATKKFDEYHRRGLLEEYKKDLKVGMLATDPAGQETRGGFFGILRARKK